MGISVALCTHNGERYVRRQLASILSQTLGADQLVVSDDASADGTVAAIEEELDAARRAGAPVPEVVVLRNAEPLGSKDVREIRKGDVVSYRLSGAGGHGPPAARRPQAIAEDIADGYVTPGFAAAKYGYRQ